MIQRGQGKKKPWMGLPICPPGPPGERLVDACLLPFFPCSHSLQRDEDRCCGSQALSALIQVVSLPHLLATLLSGFPYLVTILLVNMSSYDNAMQPGLALSHRTPDSPYSTREGTQAVGVLQAHGAMFWYNTHSTGMVTLLDESGGRESCTVGGTRIWVRRPTDQNTGLGGQNGCSRKGTCHASLVTWVWVLDLDKGREKEPALKRPPHIGHACVLGYMYPHNNKLLKPQFLFY